MWLVNKSLDNDMACISDLLSVTRVTDIVSKIQTISNYSKERAVAVRTNRLILHGFCINTVAFCPHGMLILFVFLTTK